MSVLKSESFRGRPVTAVVIPLSTANLMMANLVGKIFALAGVIGCTYWWAKDGGIEPVVTGIAAIGVLVGLFLNDETRMKRIRERGEEDKAIIKDAVIRINRENGNLNHMLKKHSYSSPRHRDAVEVKSLELLDASLSPLQQVSGYSRKAKAALAEIHRNQSLEAKDLSKLIEYLDQIKAKALKQYGPRIEDPK